MPETMIEMDDGARLRTWTAGPVTPRGLPVVMVHGGPGIPDYLAPVAGVIDDLCLVHRYDQRGTGGSHWHGEHTPRLIADSARKASSVCSPRMRPDRVLLRASGKSGQSGPPGG